MVDLNEKHYCTSCDKELTEDEAYDTFLNGCKYCHCKTGFISVESSDTSKNNTSYVDLYLQTLNNLQGRI